MAKSKIPAVKDLHAYLFMSIQGTDVQLVYRDDSDRGLALGAAFANILEQDDKLFDIFSAAMLTAIEAKEKYSSKKSNKLPKKTAKATK
jgi:hypothetical protein